MTDTYPHSLTLENFFNEMKEKYPRSTKKFCDWIDEYKKRVEWSKLFNERVSLVSTKAPKFHEIPITMQIGIFFLFTVESDGRSSLFDTEVVMTMSGYIVAMREWFARDENFQIHEEFKNTD